MCAERRAGSPVNILAIGAHPDDIVLQCGGTMAKYAAAGHAITMVVMCPGVSKRDPPSLEETIRERQREVSASAAMIGATAVWMTYRDFDLPYDYESKLPLVEQIRKTRPEVIFGHHPSDYSSDHRRASELLDECYMMAFQSGIKTESPAIQPRAMIYHMDTVGGLGFVPDAYVDITDFIQMKCRMIECHESEVRPYAGNPVVDTVEWIEVNARYRGIQAGVRYAEAFCWPRRWASLETRHLLP